MARVKLKGIFIFECDGNQKGEGCLYSRVKKGDTAEFRSLAQRFGVSVDRGTVRIGCRERGCDSYIIASFHNMEGVNKCLGCGGEGWHSESHNGCECRDCGATGFQGGRRALGL